MPNYQNPLGALMPLENKRKLVHLLAQDGIPLIEDDVYGELYFGMHGYSYPIGLPLSFVQGKHNSCRLNLHHPSSPKPVA